MKPRTGAKKPSSAPKPMASKGGKRISDSMNKNMIAAQPAVTSEGGESTAMGATPNGVSAKTDYQPAVFKRRRNEPQAGALSTGGATLLG